MPGDMMNTSWGDLISLGVTVLFVGGALWWMWLRATGRIRTGDDD